MELRIVNENPNYPPVKLIEPTTLGYIHLAAVVQPRQVSFLSAGREKAQLLSDGNHTAYQTTHLRATNECLISNSRLDLMHVGGKWPISVFLTKKYDVL